MTTIGVADLRPGDVTILTDSDGLNPRRVTVTEVRLLRSWCFRCEGPREFDPSTWVEHYRITGEADTVAPLRHLLGKRTTIEWHAHLDETISIEAPGGR